MGRCAHLVIGPAGSGKSTYCELMRTHLETLRRQCHVVNLDPAAESFSYPVAADVRELVPLEDVMSELKLGPNGGLVYAMEYLVDNIDWLEGELEEIGNDSYVLFDCPGQIELYSHVPAMRHLVGELQRMGFNLAAVYLLDSQFVGDVGAVRSERQWPCHVRWEPGHVCYSYLLNARFEPPFQVAKFVSGVLCTLSAMTSLELPHISVLSKCDLLSSRTALEEFLEADTSVLAEQLHAGHLSPRYVRIGGCTAPQAAPLVAHNGRWNGGGRDYHSTVAIGAGAFLFHAHAPLAPGTSPQFYRLNSTICNLIEEWNMVQFLPLDPNDTDSIDQILAQARPCSRMHCFLCV
mmetsp:Transcript_71739/g.159531  ORF Transcript_71739/g.159531 Transcript_71739/m.159531 type:complete len:349 (-) Transcript_71739:468-1514(-)